LRKKRRQPRTTLDGCSSEISRKAEEESGDRPERHREKLDREIEHEAAVRQQRRPFQDVCRDRRMAGFDLGLRESARAQEYDDQRHAVPIRAASRHSGVAVAARRRARQPQKQHGHRRDA
jgi:hypothetical protein